VPASFPGPRWQRKVCPEFFENTDHTLRIAVLPHQAWNRFAAARDDDLLAGFDSIEEWNYELTPRKLPSTA